MPDSFKQLEFEYGDKIICVHGQFTMVIHAGDKIQVNAIEMSDSYGSLYREVTLTETFMEKHKLEHPMTALTE